MKVLIVGCGYLGEALGKALLNRGDRVWGLRRNADALKRIESLGIRPVLADILDPSSFAALPSADAIVFCQALSRQSDNYYDTYVRGTQNLIEHYQTRPPAKIIFISSTSVYSTWDGSWVDESTDPLAGSRPTNARGNNAECLLEAEKHVLARGMGPVILRLAGIYGPGRNRLLALREGAARPVTSMNYANRIHRDDAVSAILLLLEKGAAGEVYIGADDYPSTYSEFYEWLYKQLNLIPLDAPVSGQMGRQGSNKRCSNMKLKSLGFNLRYKSFKEGYFSLINKSL